MEGIIFANISAAVAVIFILLIRKIFREKLLAKVFVMLWLAVIIRLLMPFEIFSSMSIYAPEKSFNAEISSEKIFGAEKSDVFFDDENYFNDETEVLKIKTDEFLIFIWGTGAFFTAAFFISKHFAAIKKLKENSVLCDDLARIYKIEKTRFYVSKSLISPLSFGIFKPTIIIPENLSEKELSLVILHEQIHIKDRDVLLKLLAEIALFLNWFNPLVWIAVKIFDRDIERYCDERVLKILGKEKASFYTNTLLDFAERESISISFFSAASLEERVISIMNIKNKRKNLIGTIFILLAVIILMTSFGTLPKVYGAETSEENPVGIKDIPPEEPSFTETKFIWPSESKNLSCGFGVYQGHKGIDIIGERGVTKIFASAVGRIEYAEKHTEYGNCVIITHENGMKTLYAHCEEIFVKEGENVSAGEIIATCGATGSATGSHLHFEIIENGENLDPMEYLS